MTPTTGSDEHPEVAEISALTEGLLPTDQEDAVRRHLDGCALCDDVRTSLDEIRSLLGTLPGPARMPDDVARRIDAALAAEALLDATAPAGPADTSPEDSAPGGSGVPVPGTASASTDRPEDPAAGEGDPRPADTPGARRSRVSRETPLPGATGSAAPGSPKTGPTAVPAAGRPAAPHGDRPAGRPRAAAGPGRKPARRGGGRGGARRWPRVLLSTACAAAVIGVGTLLVRTSGTGDDTAGETRSAAAPTDRTAGTLGGDGLTDRVHSLLAAGPAGTGEKTPGERGAPEATGERPLASTPLRAPQEDRVPPCVQAGTGRPETPIAAEPDVYQGTPVYLVVLPHPSDSSLVDAFVIDSSCTTASPPAAGKQLLARTVARP
ncbi:hypothetical protein IHE55_14610 [Streptomyces pactum]|uniref:Zinc-finger domain-containing protein n=1 Tax=Streptomyces pactum TaxID=68249 RepID=A0ABS0NL78_9ACTN|nr:hypothetical protein [Streptomyces pactum]MBH5335953.1 hypothetical protein [Streptomyces pactum]